MGGTITGYETVYVGSSRGMASYTLSGSDSLLRSISGDMVIGANGSIATFEQTGGRVVAGKTLQIGQDGTGVYYLKGGTLSVDGNDPTKCGIGTVVNMTGHSAGRFPDHVGRPVSQGRHSSNVDRTQLHRHRLQGALPDNRRVRRHRRSLLRAQHRIGRRGPTNQGTLDIQGGSLICPGVIRCGTETFAGTGTVIVSPNAYVKARGLNIVTPSSRLTLQFNAAGKNGMIHLDGGAPTVRDSNAPLDLQTGSYRPREGDNIVFFDDMNLFEGTFMFQRFSTNITNGAAKDANGKTVSMWEQSFFVASNDLTYGLSATRTQIRTIRGD